MTALCLLIAAFIGITALVIWADHTGWDPFARMYGSDYTAPEEVQDWRAANWKKGEQ